MLRTGAYSLKAQLPPYLQCNRLSVTLNSRVYCSPRSIAREIIPFDEAATYELLLKIDESDGKCGAIIPGTSGYRRSSAPDASNVESSDAFALTPTQLEELRSFLSGPPVARSGCVVPVEDRSSVHCVTQPIFACTVASNL